MIRNTSFIACLLACSIALPGAAQTPAPAESNDPAALRAEINRLKDIMPGQSFAMTQVAYNFNNLWFAAHAGNWPLAQFYYGDTRGRLRWALRITPSRKVSSGEVVLQPFLDSLEKGPYTKLGDALTAKDVKAFEAAYRETLEACQACHTASDKPYLRLQVPKAPAEPMIDFTPH
jgi:hypothetical protein